MAVRACLFIAVAMAPAPCAADVGTLGLSIHREDARASRVFLAQAERASSPMDGADVKSVPIYAWIYLGFSIIVICVSSYLVWKWHGEMVNEAKAPRCGCKSVVCAVCCLCFGLGTCLTCCYPIDEGDAHAK